MYYVQFDIYLIIHSYSVNIISIILLAEFLLIIYYIFKYMEFIRMYLVYQNLNMITDHNHGAQIFFLYKYFLYL